jgi:TPR repeat protein
MEPAMKRIGCIGLLLVRLCGQAWAGPFEDANAAFGRGDYATALRLWRPLAEQGDTRSQGMLGMIYDLGQGVPQDYAQAAKWYRLFTDKVPGAVLAQFRLGQIYVIGLGVPQDHAEATKWFRLAADQGYADAQTVLGFMYQDGQGVKQDYAQALKWYRLAADQGDHDAQNNLGGMYKNGQGVPQDNAEAVMWFRLAADQGYADAQNNLGASYRDGRGVPQDYVQAHKWFNLATSRYPAFEKGKRDRAVNDRDLVAAKMTPAQIAEAQELAREWKPNPRSRSSASPLLASR